MDRQAVTGCCTRIRHRSFYQGGYFNTTSSISSIIRFRLIFFHVHLLQHETCTPSSIYGLKIKPPIIAASLQLGNLFFRKFLIMRDLYILGSEAENICMWNIQVLSIECQHSSQSENLRKLRFGCTGCISQSLCFSFHFATMSTGAQRITLLSQLLDF